MACPFTFLAPESFEESCLPFYCRSCRNSAARSVVLRYSISAHHPP